MIAATHASLDARRIAIPHEQLSEWKPPDGTMRIFPPPQSL